MKKIKVISDLIVRVKLISGDSNACTKMFPGPGVGPSLAEAKKAEAG